MRIKVQERCAVISRYKWVLVETANRLESEARRRFKMNELKIWRSGEQLTKRGFKSRKLSI